MNGLDFIYPIFSTGQRETINGYYYVPLIDVPGLMYATVPEKISLADIFIQVFPVAVVCLLLCLIAGKSMCLLEAYL